MTLYERIRKLRIEQEMSQEELAFALGYKDRSMITKIEAGKVDISQKKISAFAKALSTTTAYLMGWDEEPDQAEILSEDEHTLIDGYRTLPQEGKEYMIKQITAAKALYGEKSDISSSEIKVI